MLFTILHTKFQILAWEMHVEKCIISQPTTHLAEFDAYDVTKNNKCKP